MPISITIAGVEKATSIEPGSFNLQRSLTNQVDTLKMRVIKNPDNTYKPDIVDDVVVTDADSNVIFGGQIITVDETVEGKDIEIIDCSAKDYTFDMDRSLVIGSWTDTSVDDIIADINADFLTGYDISEVNCPFVIGYIAFNYEYPSKCFQQLAELTGYEWYVDYQKVIHFFSRDTRPAPFNLTDTSGNFLYNTLKINRDVKNLRNTVIVRGGEYQGTTVSETEEADGDALVYKQGNRYSNVTVTVNGVSQTVGIDNVDDPAGYDCLYNFTEKFIRFKTATKPAAGHLVVVGGNPHIPVIVKVRGQDSVEVYGEREYKIIDTSIASKQGARDRAKAEIDAWAAEISEASFDTYESGLDVGQQINVQSTIRGIDQDYIISKISTKLINGEEFLHSVTLITTRTFGIIEFLQKLLMSKDKEIKIAQDEALDEIFSYNEDVFVSDGDAATTETSHNPQAETVTVGESTTVQALNYAIEFVLGPQEPSGTKRPFIFDGSPLA